jgi:hypothetical protein
LFRPVAKHVVHLCDDPLALDQPRGGICFRLAPEEVHLLKEPSHRPLVKLRQPGNDHCAYAVLANLIFAELLICDADKPGRPGLSNVGGEPGKPQAPPYLAVNEIGFIFHRAALQLQAYGMQSYREEGQRSVTTEQRQAEFSK